MSRLRPIRRPSAGVVTPACPGAGDSELDAADAGGRQAAWAGQGPRPACAGYHTAEGARRAADGASRGTSSPGGVQSSRSAGVTAGRGCIYRLGRLKILKMW